VSEDLGLWKCVDGKSNNMLHVAKPIWISFVIAESMEKMFYVFTSSCNLYVVSLVPTHPGAHSFVSLKFVLKRTRAVADAAAAASVRPPIGNISVSFYECQLGQSTYIQEDVDSTKRLPSEKDASSEFSAQSQPGAKKAFASVAGGTMAKEAPDTKPAKSNGGGNKKPRLQQKYVRGRHIQTVTLHYTSAMGFVQLGIM